MDFNTKKGMQLVCELLRKDEAYYNAWKANIAVAFQDVAREEGIVTEANIHKISNEAADRFLKLLTRKG